MISNRRVTLVTYSTEALAHAGGLQQHVAQHLAGLKQHVVISLQNQGAGAEHLLAEGVPQRVRRRRRDPMQPQALCQECVSTCIVQQPLSAENQALPSFVPTTYPCPFDGMPTISQFLAIIKHKLSAFQ